MNGIGNKSDQGLIYEDLLPLQWRLLGNEAPTLDMAKFDAKNEELLKFIDVLDEHPNESAVDHTSQNQELARVEIKFDLLLSLVSQLLAVYFPLPSTVPVRLTPGGVQWLSPKAYDGGADGLVEIYLCDRCPRPLIFPAKVEHSAKEGGMHRVSVRFTAMSDPVRDRLEKMIFRHHRRGVALARRQMMTDPKAPST
jgi:hypothetical protein